MLAELAVQKQLFPLLTVFAALLGACIGSFLNVVIYRVPLGQSLWHPPSHCPGCGHRIAVWQNVPILAWFFLRGRCFYCRTRISFRYPLIEAVTALLFTAAWVAVYRAQLPWVAAPRLFFLLGALLAVAVIDVEHGVVPDGITLSGSLFALVTALLLPFSVALPGGWGVAAENPGGMTLGVLALLGAAGCPCGTHATAFLEALLGLGAGLLFPTTVRFACQAIWGRRTIRPAAPVAFRLAEGRLRIEGACDAPPADLLPPTFDEILIEAETPASGPAPEAAARPAAARLIVTPDSVVLNGREVPLANAGVIEGRLRRWHLCRDVFGWGDVKLLGMIGAFVGAEAMMGILLLAALAATLVGLAALAVRRGRAVALPFATFLALAAAVWVFFGARLVFWYLSLLLP